MNVLFTLLFASLSSSLTPNDNQNHATLLPLPNHIITQFPNPTWLENIAVRSNGDLLLTESAPTASLHLVSNLDLNHHSYSSKSNGSGSTTKRTTTHTFDSLQALFGIAEPLSDVFVVVGRNVSSAASGGGAGDGSENGDGKGNGNPFFAWGVDFRRTTRPTTHTTASNSNSDAHETTPKIKSITQLTQALLPNGVTSLPPPGNPNTVLIADSFAGLVWRLDIPYG